MRIFIWLAVIGVPYVALGLPIAGLFGLALVVVTADLITTNYVEREQR